MILTITLNPSIDMNYHIDKLEINQVNRTGNPVMTAGGKGLNVTRVIHQNDEPVMATGFLGGMTGTYISQKLERQGIKHNFIKIRQNTRHCLALMHEGNQTEVLESGPEISMDESELFIENYKKFLDLCNVVVASGSIPAGPGTAFYQRLISLANKKGRKFILDTSGDALKEGIKAHPFLIKPNLHEIELLLRVKIESEEELINAVRRLAQKGPKNVVISLGDKGAIAILNNVLYRVRTTKIHVVSAVGSGDSMVAGLALGIARGYNAKKLLALGSCFGALNALESETGYIDVNRIQKFMDKTEVVSL